MEQAGKPKSLPQIALIGRPNVGKSTLFNWLAKRRVTIVNEIPGATRDRKYKEISFCNSSYLLVDTGGLLSAFEGTLAAKVMEQTHKAIADADVVLFLVDAKAGILPSDIEIADNLRRSECRVVLVANKCDSTKLEQAAQEFQMLLKAPLFTVSAAQGMGIRSLFAQVEAMLPKERRVSSIETKGDLEPDDESDDQNKQQGVPEQLKVAIVGKPNVGKSSFLNKLLGEDRHLTSDIPGTTIDSVDSKFAYRGQEYLLIDTAGIRKKRSISQDLEKQAVAASLKALDRCSVALFLIDSTKGLTEQDFKIASFIEKKGKGVVIVVNKWDLAHADGLLEPVFARQLKETMPFLAFAPIKFVSALTGMRVAGTLGATLEVAKEYHKRVSTSRVNKWLADAVLSHPPPVVKGRRLKFFFGSQVSLAPPIFVVTCNDPNGIHFSYTRYLTNSLRMAFNFKGVPLRIVYHGREKRKKAH